jgi:lipoyl-dependent peroxiredoxin
MAETRHASATWSGNLTEGAGMLQYISSGAFSRMPITWGSRTEAHEGRTSPEELLAAAHASCFSMAFANQLAKNGTIAERLDVRVDVTADKREAGWTVLSSAIKVSGVVPGIDAETFARVAEAAKDGCPISRALVGNVELSVEPTLLEK